MKSKPNQPPKQPKFQKELWMRVDSKGKYALLSVSASYTLRRENPGDYVAIRELNGEYILEKLEVGAGAKVVRVLDYGDVCPRFSCGGAQIPPGEYTLVPDGVGRFRVVGQPDLLPQTGDSECRK